MGKEPTLVLDLENTPVKPLPPAHRHGARRGSEDRRSHLGLDVDPGVPPAAPAPEAGDHRAIGGPQEVDRASVQLGDGEEQTGRDTPRPDGGN
jgi:hypothetical protein